MKISPNSYKGFVPNSNQPILSPQLQPRYRPLGLIAGANFGKNFVGLKNLQPIELNYNYSHQKNNFPEQKLNIRNLPMFSKFDSSENIPIITSNGDRNTFKQEFITKKEKSSTFIEKEAQPIYVEAEKRQVSNVNNRNLYNTGFSTSDKEIKSKESINKTIVTSSFNVNTRNDANINDDNIVINSNAFPIMQKKDIKITDFLIGNIIKIDDYRIVKKALKMPENSPRIMNILLKKMITKNGSLFNEYKKYVKICKQIKHINAVQFYEIFEDENYVYLCSEYVKGYSLLEMMKIHCLTEFELSHIFYQLLNFALYLKAQNITSNYLDLSNIIISENNGQMLVKITDFLDFDYLSLPNTKTVSNFTIYTYPGMFQTPINSEYNLIWNLGIIFFILVFNDFPYTFKSRDELEQSLKSCTITKTIDHFHKLNQISENALHFMRCLLSCQKLQPHQTESLITHPFLLTINPNKSCIIKLIMNSSQQIINKFYDIKLQNLIQYFMRCLFLISDQKNWFLEILDSKDDNDLGVIKIDLLLATMKSRDPTSIINEQDIADSIKTIGLKRNSYVDYNEFLSEIIHSKMNRLEKEIYNLFKNLKSFKNESASYSDISNSLYTYSLTSIICNSMMNRIIKNDRIEFNDLMNLIKEVAYVTQVENLY